VQATTRLSLTVKRDTHITYSVIPAERGALEGRDQSGAPSGRLWIRGSLAIARRRRA